jgi:hypothetical protein
MCESLKHSNNPLNKVNPLIKPFHKLFQTIPLLLLGQTDCNHYKLFFNIIVMTNKLDNVKYNIQVLYIMLLIEIYLWLGNLTVSEHLFLVIDPIIDMICLNVALGYEQQCVDYRSVSLESEQVHQIVDNVYIEGVILKTYHDLFVSELGVHEVNFFKGTFIDSRPLLRC